MTIRVKNPKTATATIDNVFVSDPTPGPWVEGSIDRWFEPMWTGDGRMTVGRLGRSTLPNAPSEFRKGIIYDNAYSVYEGGKICDYNRLNDHVRPIAYGHYDKMVDKEKYPWTKFPMRSPKGELYDKYSDNGGFSYPWVDKKASVMVVSTVGDDAPAAREADPSWSRFPIRCYDGSTDDCSKQVGFLGAKVKNMAMFGSWTKGRLVMLDEVN
jgi:hypothetical protein